MNVLIITGKLASTLVKKISANSSHNVHVLIADTPIAAFLTPKSIINEIQKNEIDTSYYDILLAPGLIRKDLTPVGDKLQIPVFKGSTDAADLDIVLDLLHKIKLSPKKAADKLIEEELKRRAIEFIENFDKDIKKRDKLLKKPDNILVGNIPVGEDFPQRVLAEIANAPLLSPSELLKRARYYVNCGADMVDLGMIAGENQAHKIPSMVNILKENLDIPVSIDTLQPIEIEAAVNAGVDMVLSLDHGNYEELLPLLEEEKIPSVILPTNYRKNWVPETWEDRVNYTEDLRRKCKNIEIIADLILDPVNSKSIVDSIIAARAYKERNRDPLFWGVGNVTELIDTDSVGVNALLSGIGMELGASILFTPEESGKTKGSVKELSISSQIMFLAKNRGSVPKDLGINLLVFKDKRRTSDIIEKLEVPVFTAQADTSFKPDPEGSFRIIIHNGLIKAIHYINMEPVQAVVGRTAKEVYDEILRRKLVSRMEHAAYLGSELQKAEIAVQLGKNYIQDLDLFNKFY